MLVKKNNGNKNGGKNVSSSAEFMRLERNTGIELLWLYVLSILKGKNLHAYALKKEIEERFFFKVGEVTTYVVLYKLESRGFVSSKADGNRKVYGITLKGRELLSLAKKRFNEILKKALE